MRILEDHPLAIWSGVLTTVGSILFVLYQVLTFIEDIDQRIANIEEIIKDFTKIDEQFQSAWQDEDFDNHRQLLAAIESHDRFVDAEVKLAINRLNLKIEQEIESRERLEESIRDLSYQIGRLVGLHEVQN